MVGDEDQSIYGFRAAYPEALLSFEKSHPNARVLLMEENFRSNAKIVEAAEQFIEKNQFRHKKSMKAHRDSGADIQNIEVRSRKAQYSYLLKVAENCSTETAVLYRDNESILPVVDLLERNGISYRIKNADLTFFSHRVVLDIESIIKFAQKQTNTELFMQIYYKIGTYMSKMAALEACRISEEKNISVLEAALQFGKIPAGTKKSVKSMQTHMQGLLTESASKAIYRITHFMGYLDYLERYHIKDSKIQILEALATNEPSAMGLVERLHELSSFIQEKKYDTECKLILSTIHSSKGLEYDKVYIMDAKDGIFPESVIKNRQQASKEELKEYEEERRLYYVGVTRAKNTLCLFTFKGESTFSGELLKMNIYSDAGGYSSKNIGTSRRQSARKSELFQASRLQKKQKKRTVTETEYLEKREEIATTGYIKHKKYGRGAIRSISGDIIEIEFESKTTKCQLKFMMENELIE